MMKNYEKYGVELSTLLKKNWNIIDISPTLYNTCKNMGVDELNEYLQREWVDNEPKILTKEQRNELEYVYLRRGNNPLKFIGTIWFAGSFELIEDYYQFDKTQEYDIKYILENEQSEVVYADKISFNKNYLDLNYFANQNTNFEFRIGGINDIKQIFNRTLIGTRTADYKDRFTHIISNTGDIFVDIGTKRNTIQYNVNEFVGNEVTFKLENKVYSIKLNNGNFIELGSCLSTDFTSTIPLIFGALNTSGTITSHSQFDLKYLNISDASTMITLKPAYDVEGSLALYDTTNNKYFYLV